MRCQYDSNGLDLMICTQRLRQANRFLAQSVAMQIISTPRLSRRGPAVSVRLQQKPQAGRRRAGGEWLGCPRLIPDDLRTLRRADSFPPLCQVSGSGKN
jgi:hypothetical protein